MKQSLGRGLEQKLRNIPSTSTEDGAVAAAAEQEQETAPEMETAAGAAVLISARKATGGRFGKDTGKATTRATRADSIPASDRSQCRSRMERSEAEAAITDR